jgi:hypothetical protein
LNNNRKKERGKEGRKKRKKEMIKYLPPLSKVLAYLSFSLLKFG